MLGFVNQELATGGGDERLHTSIDLEIIANVEDECILQTKVGLQCGSTGVPQGN